MQNWISEDRQHFCNFESFLNSLALIDITFRTKKQPEKGDLLVSDPFANDLYFSRSVVLLCDHDETGSFGFVLNNMLDVKLHALVPKFPNKETRIALGGPVDKDSIFYIHAFPNIDGSQEVGESLYFGGDFQQIIDLLVINPDEISNIRFFLGYSGWSANQLNEEMKNNAWVVSNTKNNNDVFLSNDKSFWNKIMKQLGRKFEVMSNFPIDPNNN